MMIICFISFNHLFYKISLSASIMVRIFEATYFWHYLYYKLKQRKSVFNVSNQFSFVCLFDSFPHNYNIWKKNSNQFMYLMFLGFVFAWYFLERSHCVLSKQFLKGMGVGRRIRNFFFKPQLSVFFYKGVDLSNKEYV